MLSAVEVNSAISSRKRAAPTFVRNRIIAFQVRSNFAVRKTRHSRSAASLARRRAACVEVRRSSVRFLVLRRAAGGFGLKLYAPAQWVTNDRLTLIGIQKRFDRAIHVMRQLYEFQIRFEHILVIWLPIDDPDPSRRTI